MRLTPELSSAWSPIIFTRSTIGIGIAQTYVSSHPAKGLFLISPPKDFEFLFEPKFPIGILEVQSQSQSRDGPGEPEYDERWVTRMVVKDVDNEEALMAVGRWLDDIGV